MVPWEEIILKMNRELEDVLNELAEYVLYGEENIINAYKKEEIHPIENGIQDNSDPKQIYKKFKQIEERNFWRMYADDIFYKQAKYLENYEDDCEIKEIHRNSYHIFEINYTYSGFSYADFRTYFSWRTKIRKGEFQHIQWDYEQIYINELLNKIGCKDEIDAIEKLIEFWKGYRKYESKVDSRMSQIIKEFYIINDIKIPYTEIVKKFPEGVDTLSKDLREVNKGIYTDKFNFFNKISAYKIARSKLLGTEYGYVLNGCIEKVFGRIHQEFIKNDLFFPDLLMHKNITEYWWKPLRDYNIYQKNEKDKTIIIEGTEKYECKDGVWSRTTYSSHLTYRNTIGYMLKTMEHYIREYLAYHMIKLPEKEEMLKDIKIDYCPIEKRNKIYSIYKLNLQEWIKTETIAFLEDHQIPKNAFKKSKEEPKEIDKEEKIEVVFHQDQFAKIREQSEEIQKALIIDEENEEENEETIVNKQNINEEHKIHINEVYRLINQQESANTRKEDLEKTEENVFKIFTSQLNQKEKEIVKAILDKKDVENRITQIAQEENEMLEVMISNINDKSLDTIGDTIIESDMTSIYEEYENEIKQLLN